MRNHLLVTLKRARSSHLSLVPLKVKRGGPGRPARGGPGRFRLYVYRYRCVAVINISHFLRLIKLTYHDINILLNAPIAVKINMRQWSYDQKLRHACFSFPRNVVVLRA